MTSIAPWISVPNASEALAFYTKAFGAVELERLEEQPDEVILAQLSIDGADFWIQTDPEGSPEALNGRSVRMIIMVEDPDPLFARALAAGATEVAAMHEDFGWRVGRLCDPAGHHWEIGKRIPD